MIIGIPRERSAGETRVAATPDTVGKLAKLGYQITVESGAGALSGFSDQVFEQAGASIADQATTWASDVVLKVNAPLADLDGQDEASQLKDGASLISFFWPAQNEDRLNQLSERNINVMAMDAVPRISRAQAMDALSSMANIAGYRAVTEGAHAFGRFLNGQITAAGKVAPAKILIIGAGVAGLAAIGAAGSMGAIVRAFDTRPEVKDQVESLGAEFLELDFEEDGSSGSGYAKVMSKEFIDAEMALFREQAKEVDIIITTALIPGRPAPKLILQDMVDVMKPGSVIVDLAAPNGGNCEATVPGELHVTENGVKVIGYTDLAGRMPGQASQLYGMNLVNLIKLMTPEKDGELVIDFDDQVVRGVTVLKEGNITWPPPAVEVSAAPKQAEAKPAIEPKPEKEPMSSNTKHAIMGGVALLFGWAASAAPTAFLSSLTVFVLACIVGYYVVTNVTHALHTPLMSVTNAISGIIILGALLQAGSPSGLVNFLVFIAVGLATINIVGGFVVTRRMLKMFQK